ncbi:hypothetical protein NDU88_001290 [Pleurodeles waltl]|uniref:Uncharacterized protein n=1 Tax=Pleurodeles waltl TaxID=8319 RepID=A0AAV7WK24_PLEWA|nr:hypothetical protein NDU88_001290 [Pleurodeles waltl]
MRKIRRTPGLIFKSPDWSRNQDSCGPDTETRIAGPGEHTNEPAMLQEKRGQARPLEEKKEEDGISGRKNEDPQQPLPTSHPSTTPLRLYKEQ